MTTTTTTDLSAPKIPNEQLDSLVAPIALYPDNLLALTLAASTYPLEIIQLQQWMGRNKTLKDKALMDAVAKQPWDPSIQNLAAVPDLVGRLAENIQWTTDLGNAFLAQQQDVMSAVQRMRVKAQDKGALKTSSETVVKTEMVSGGGGEASSSGGGGKEVIVIEQTNPQTVYVPSYDPEVVYGPSYSSYPYYPYTYPGYYPGMGLAWGTGILIGAGIANNWWGDCDWNGGDININNNNNFNRNEHQQRQHQPWPGEAAGSGSIRANIAVTLPTVIAARLVNSAAAVPAGRAASEVLVGLAASAAWRGGADRVESVVSVVQAAWWRRRPGGVGGAGGVSVESGRTWRRRQSRRPRWRR